VITKFVEAGHGTEPSTIGNWGKFVIARFSHDEWAQPVRFPGCSGSSLIGSQGWRGTHFMVFDLATGEGAMFQPGGHAPSDLNRHQIWVCPLFEPFLVWLYEFQHEQPASWWDQLPAHVVLPSAGFALSGYRREGPPLSQREQDAIRAQRDAESTLVGMSVLADRLATELARWQPLIDAAKAALAVAGT
jgi:hypothetical protein